MSESLKKNTPRLLDELAALARWRDERLSSHQKYLAEIDEEDNRLRFKQQEIERKLKSNTVLREQVLNQLRRLPIEEGHRSHSALQEALIQDREVLEARAAALQHLQELNRVELERRLRDPSLAQDLEDFERFKEVEPSLATLPSSYRKVIEAHNDSLRGRLKPLFDLAEGSSIRLDAEPAVLGLVASVDPEEGPPAALALVLPVDFDVYRDWGNHAEDISAHLAYRCVSLIVRLLKSVSAESAPLAYKEFFGCISIQVWLGDHVVKADIRKLTEELVMKVREEAWELGAARLDLQAVWVSPFTIAPDAEDEPGDKTDPVPTPVLVDDLGAEGGESEGKEAEDLSPRTRKPVAIVLRRGGHDD